MKRLLFIGVLLLCVSSALWAQKIHDDVRYRLVSREVSGALLDNTAYNYPSNESSLSYQVTNTPNSLGNSSLWYIRRTDGGWTLQNVSTNRYLALTETTYSYTWNGQTYTSVQRELRTNETLSGDSTLWSVDYQDGFRLTNAASPQWALGLYHWSDGYGQNATPQLLHTSWNYEGYAFTFDIVAEDGTIVTDEGTPGQIFSALHLNGKKPMRLNTAPDEYLVTMGSRYAGGDYDARVTWENTDASYAYSLTVDGAEMTDTGFRIKNISCNDTYPFHVSDADGFELVSGRFAFTTLPIVELQATGINGTNYVHGTFCLQDPDYEGVDTIYTAETKVRGATAQRYPKKPYNVKLRQVDGVTDQDANLLGLRNTHTWILDAMYVDRIRMRNRVCFDTWNEIDRLPYETNYDGRNGTVGRFVEVFVAGEYQGIYCLTDKINRKLLNLTKVQFNLDSTEVTPRGLLYKGKQWGDDTYLHTYTTGAISSSTTWGNWELEYPDDYPSQAAWTPLRSLITYGRMSEARFIDNFEQNYYFDNLLDYVLLQLAYNLEDNGMKNMYISTKNIQKAGKRMIFTVWDMDSSLGGLWDGSYNDITADTTYVTRVYPLSRLFSKNLMGFRDSLRLKWHDLRTTVLSPERLAERLDTYAELLTTSGAWAREYTLWGSQSNLRENLEDEIAYVKAWYDRNTEYLNELLPELPTGIERLQITPNAAQGIYTIDGRRIEGKSWHDLPHGIYIVNGQKVMR